MEYRESNPDQIKHKNLFLLTKEIFFLHLPCVLGLIFTQFVLTKKGCVCVSEVGLLEHPLSVFRIHSEEVTQYWVSPAPSIPLFYWHLLPSSRTSSNLLIPHFNLPISQFWLDFWAWLLILAYEIGFWGQWMNVGFIVNDSENWLEWDTNNASLSSHISNSSHSQQWCHPEQASYWKIS